jgi:hypothetical protein
MRVRPANIHPTYHTGVSAAGQGQCAEMRPQFGYACGRFGRGDKQFGKGRNMRGDP